MIAQASEPLIRWDWIGRHLDDIGDRLIEHIVLTAIAVGLGFVIALALAVVSIRYRRLATPITWATGILYTIPSIALFAILVPWTGLTRTTAEIGLVSYTLLILVRNIVAGIDQVPAGVREAAIGMGYTPLRMLFTIELPLALPVIIAGLRIATVTTIGLVTITALIGLGGLGFFILDGLNRFFNTPIFVGAVLSIALAVVADVAFLILGRVLTPWAKRRAAA